METNAAVQQQKQMVARAVENETILKNEQQQLTRLQTSPYFGRIDVAEDGDTDTLYIGTATFMDQNDFLVYDWRAPVASIYYNGTLGPVNYDTPTGQISAELLNKRQFTIQDGKITAMFDTNETVGDECCRPFSVNRATPPCKYRGHDSKGTKRYYPRHHI